MGIGHSWLFITAGLSFVISFQLLGGLLALLLRPMIRTVSIGALLMVSAVWNRASKPKRLEVCPITSKPATWSEGLHSGADYAARWPGRDCKRSSNEKFTPTVRIALYK
jgi:hypothetical protein